MNPCKKTIGWADFTWNPSVGCKRGCRYCCAKRMNDRFKWIPYWTTPVFYPDRLIEPSKMKKPAKIFVVLMGDLFGEWIRRDWINRVIRVCEENPRHTFMFLTKNPERYLDFDFPGNTMLGCTITGEENFYHKKRFTMIMRELNLRNYRTFVSIEPILASLEGIPLSMFDLVIVGAETGRKPTIPQRHWINNIKHPNIFYKNNILKYFPDLNNSTNGI